VKIYQNETMQQKEAKISPCLFLQIQINIYHKLPHSPRLVPTRSGVLPPTGLLPTLALLCSADVVVIITSVSS
jgi:hypothetical protein